MITLRGAEAPLFFIKAKSKVAEPNFHGTIHDIKKQEKVDAVYKWQEE